MNEILKDLFITTLNITEELFAITNENNAKHELIHEIALKSNLGLDNKKVEEIFKKELGW